MKMPNLLKEIDFESLEKSVKNGQLNSVQEYESQAKQIFSHVLKKYESMSPALHKLCSGVLAKCIGQQPQLDTPVQKPAQNKMPSLGSVSRNVATSGGSTALGYGKVGATSRPMASNIPPTNNYSTVTSGITLPQVTASGVVQLTKEEKKILGNKIRKLNQKYMRGIINIVSNEHQLNNGTLEFDINRLSPETNRKLEKYVNECIAQVEQENNGLASGTGAGISQGTKGSQQVYGGHGSK